MRNPLTRMGLSVQIGLAVLLPVLGMIALAVMLIRQGAEDFTVQSDRGIESGGLVELVGLTPIFSDLATKLQAERGLSALQLSGIAAETALKERIAATDATLQVLDTTLAEVDPAGFGTKYAADVAAIRANVEALDELRGKTLSGDIAPEEAFATYNAITAQIIKLLEYTARLGSDADVSDGMTAYTAILQASEYLGQQRALGGIGFSMGFFDTPTYRRFIQVMNARDGSLELFRRYATVPEIEFYDETVRGPVVEEVAQMTQVVIEYATTGNTGDIEGQQWFDTISKELALLRTVEARVANNLADLVAQKQAAFEDRMTFSIALCAVLVLLALAFSFLVARSFISATKRLTATMEAAAAGDYDAEVRDTGRGDEIGAMARTVEVFKDAVKRAEELGREQASERERQRETAETRARTLGELTSEFDQQASAALQSFISAAEQLSQLSERMTSSADEANAQSNAAASASEMAAQNVQNVASAAEELSASIGEISRQVAQGSTMTSAAVGEAERADQRVQSLSEAAQKIGDVVNLINDIAGQTNLLALNATIEAARAGEAGKGFAVVASEVKNLAQQTGKATEEIAAQIGGIQSATTDAVSAIKGISGTITQISEVVTSISSAVEQQGAATQEIANSVQQAAAGTQEVSSNIANVSAASRTTGEVAGEVRGSAGEMKRQSEGLRQAVDAFLTRVRAA